MLNNPSHPSDIAGVLQGLKAVADPTRIRLLALLSHGERSVNEICQIVGQSQPRVSRHLRVLTEAGFLVRFREQKLVYYRQPAEGRGPAWWGLLRQMLRTDDPQIQEDRQRMSAASSAAQGREELSDLAALLLEEIGPVGIGSLLDIGTGTGRMIEILGRFAQHAVGMDISTSALKQARQRVHGAGLAHVEFQRGDMYRLPAPDASFDLVSLDRVLAQAERPEAAISEAARTLKPGGRLLIVENFADITIHGGNPLLLLQRWIKGAGLATRRLHPCDLASGHYLIALAGRVDTQQVAA